MGKFKRLKSIALAAVLATALCAPTAAYAADSTLDGATGYGANGTAGAEDVTKPQVSAANGASTTSITGTIKATTLKVTVPTKVAFYVDPGEAAGTTVPGDWPAKTKIGQFTNPSNFTVKNYSAVDVYGYVSGVVCEDVTLVNSGSVEKPGGVAPSKANASRIKVMVGLTDKDAAMSFGTASDWMTTAVDDADGKRYFAFNKTNKGKLGASPDGTTADGYKMADGTAVPGSYTMTIRGQVKGGGWAENDSFLVKPTFKIVTTEPK